MGGGLRGRGFVRRRLILLDQTLIRQAAEHGAAQGIGRGRLNTLRGHMGLFPRARKFAPGLCQILSHRIGMVHIGQHKAAACPNFRRTIGAAQD
jgi:hypothetical protein